MIKYVLKWISAEVLMCKGDPLFWNEHGERVPVMISSSDAGIDDIPRVMREHRDLRRALARAVEMLEQLDMPGDLNGDLDRIRAVRRRNPL